MTVAVLSAGDRLHLHFTRRGDRWEHAVHFGIAGQIVWQINSEEGTATDDWPPSPPFQSLDLHAQPDGRKFALLVGMAGASHWSASIETDSIGERILFDVACRIKSEPHWLGSSYVFAESSGMAGQSDSESKRNLPRVETIPVETGLMRTIPGGTTPASEQSIIETTNRRLVVGVTRLSGPRPRTVRWKYAFSAPRAGA